MFDHIHDPGARVRALCEYGCKVEVDESVPPRRYCRSGLEMIRMANVYFDEGDLESAFILYSKYIALFVEKLPKHSEYGSTNASERAVIKKKLKHLFPLAEEIKNKLKARYTKEEIKRLEEEKIKEKELDAQRRLQQKEDERKRKVEASLLQEEVKKRHELEEHLLHEQEAELRRLQEEERRKLNEADSRGVAGGMAGAVAGAATAIGGLSVDGQGPSSGGGGGFPDGAPPAYSEAFPVPGDRSILGPSVGPGILKPGATPTVPSRDLKPSAPPSAPQPQVDRNTKPDHFTSIGGNTQNKYGLRDIHIPTDIETKFLNIAFSNTAKNIETCGLLCGKLSRGAFWITHLVVPKQSGTPDSCMMEGEVDIFAYQDKYDLMTFGWIHTHPSQTAFLSSVDLHTHFPYQKMLPESIAIVCSPKYKETGYFSITPDHGMEVLGKCTQRGFHEHQKHPALFETCSHVKIDGSSSVTLADLR